MYIIILIASIWLSRAQTNLFHTQTNLNSRSKSATSPWDTRGSLLYSPWLFHPYEAQEIHWSQTAPPSQPALRQRFVTPLKQSTIDVNVALYHVNYTINDISSAPPDVLHDLQSQARNTCLLISMHDNRSFNAIIRSDRELGNESTTRQLEQKEGGLDRVGDEDNADAEESGTSPHEQGGVCHRAFANIDLFEDIITCGGAIRVPKAESWDYWRLLDAQDKYTGSKGWQTLNEDKLRMELLDISQSDYRKLQKGLTPTSPPKTIFERTPYFADGSRKSYLEFDLTPHLRKMFRWASLSAPPTRAICYATKSTDSMTGRPRYDNIVKIGDLIRVRAPETGRMAPLTETSMRVFFDPGWRLDATVIGNHLSFRNRLSIKLNSCAGKLDDLAIRSAPPVKWYTKGSESLTALSGTSWIKSLFSNSRLYPQALQFVFKVDALQEEDSTADWRRAAYLLRRKERKAALVKVVRVSNTSTPTTRKNKTFRAPADEQIKMYLCLYGDPTEQFGLPVGSTQFALASTDAAEFVAISILVLLGLPVSCMWTLGCLGYKHKKLRQELRRMRLMQQRDQIETRLAGYLGFDHKTNEDSSDEETDTFETQPTRDNHIIEYSQLAVQSTASPLPHSSPESAGESATRDIDAPLLINSEARS